MVCGLRFAVALLLFGLQSPSMSGLSGGHHARSPSNAALPSPAHGRSPSLSSTSPSHARAPSISTTFSPSHARNPSATGGSFVSAVSPGSHRRSHTLMDQLGELSKEPFRRVTASPVVKAIREASDRWARDGDKRAPSVSGLVSAMANDPAIRDCSHVKALVATTRAMGNAVDDLKTSAQWLEFVATKLFLVGGARPAQCLCSANPKRMWPSGLMLISLTSIKLRPSFLLLSIPPPR
jgi:hypothetical protein